MNHTACMGTFGSLRGHYSLQTASEIKSNLRFEISDHNYKQYRGSFNSQNMTLSPEEGEWWSFDLRFFAAGNNFILIWCPERPGVSGYIDPLT